MKKLAIACILIFIAITLCACSLLPEDNIISNLNVQEMIEWISPDGVHYWVGQGGMNRFGMAPRYDKEGHLIID